MKTAIAYPPIPSPKGIPLISQNRQFQWFHRPTFIYPVVPACAATMLKRAGHEAIWLDGIASGWTPDEFMTRLEHAKPGIIFIEAKTPIIIDYWKWVDRIHQRMPDLICVLMGDHVTAMPAESFEKCTVDYVLTGGDYDFLAVNLVEHLSGKGELEAGIWRRQDGKAAPGGQFVCAHDLSSLPPIDRDLSCWSLYSTRNGNFRRTPGAYIMAGRDCWHGKCTFCSWTTLYPNYRVRKPVEVVDEIGGLIETQHVREIMDDTGTFPVGAWLNEFCMEMIKRGYNKHVTMNCNMRFGRLTTQEYELMRKAGFRFVLFGLESANQSTLDRLQKGLGVEQILDGARMASRAGLDVHVTVMLGYPWEGPAEVANTVQLGRRLLIEGIASTLQVTMVVPYPGTPLFKELDSQGLLLTHDWSEFDMRRNVMKCGVSDDMIKDAIRSIYRGFLHPRALINRALHTRHPVDDLRFYWRGALSLAGHLRDFR
jgi:anaerobic magnesium-protoporphyrin IX monomethyl ester cyclase